MLEFMDQIIFLIFSLVAVSIRAAQTSFLSLCLIYIKNELSSTVTTELQSWTFRVLLILVYIINYIKGGGYSF